MKVITRNMRAECKLFRVCILFSILFSLTQNKAINKKDYLWKYGYLDSLNPEPKVLEIAIKQFQTINGITPTGYIDNDTLKQMTAPRCGRPDNDPMPLMTISTRWRHSSITYKIVNWTEPFSKSILKAFLEDAIRQWTANANLKLTETKTKRGDIEVYFTKQDGPNENLGYAYPPSIGDMYLDQEEDWTTSCSLSHEKIYFGWVLTHELGHALGLPHTNNRKSIMNPYYQADVKEASQSDRNNLKELYQDTLTGNAVCSGSSIDAIIDSKNDKKVVIGREFWIVTREGIESKTHSLDMHYADLTGTIDASFTTSDKTYILSESYLYIFNYDKKPKMKLLSVVFHNLPPNIDAAFVYAPTKSIYFFKGSSYYICCSNNIKGKWLLNRKDMSNDFAGVPNNIEAATYLEHSRVLFIKESRCYTFDMNLKKVVYEAECFSSFYDC